MDKERIINLINDLYRTTSLFPKKEPLKYKMREPANNILFYFISFKKIEEEYSDLSEIKREENISEINKNFEILDGYLEISKWQNWASYFVLLELQDKFKDLKEDLKEDFKEVKNKLSLKEKNRENVYIPEKEKIEKIEKKNNKKNNQKLTPRKEKILSFLKERDRVQVNEVSKIILPSVAKRTLRRDFVDLLEMGIIERIGERNETSYRIREA